MANELRVRQNFLSGVISDNPLSNSATTINSAQLANLPVIGSTNHMALVLDPDGTGNGPEIVWVTAHTASATSATVVRAREGTTGVQHAQNTPWIHAPTAYDYPLNVTSSTRPSTGGLPYYGQRIYESDTFRELIYSQGAWVTVSPVSATVATGESYSAASYGDCATHGPAVTLYTGTTALVTLTSACNSTNNIYVYMSFAVSGATTIAASDANAAGPMNIVALANMQIARTFKLTGLTPGNNTFTVKYKHGTATAGSWLNRDITVVGLP